MFRKIAVAIGFIVVVVAGISWYFWQQATALPDWYTQDARDSEISTELPPPLQRETAGSPQSSSDPGLPKLVWEPARDAHQGLAQPSSASEKQTAKKKPPTTAKNRKQVIRNFHVRQLARHPQFKQAIKSSRAHYERGKLEAGIVIDISAISRKSMPSRDRKTLDRLIKAFPPLRGKSVYLGIEDYPPQSSEFLQLSSKTSIRIGNLKLSLEQVGKKIGSSGTALKQMFNRELKVNKVPHPQNSEQRNQEN